METSPSTQVNNVDSTSTEMFFLSRRSPPLGQPESAEPPASEQQSAEPLSSTLTSFPISPERNDGEATAGFSIREARGLLKDLFEPNPTLYWGDLLASTVVGYGGYLAATMLPWDSWGFWAAFVAAMLGLYRASIFNHELVHLPPDKMPGFHGVWNVLCGVPLLTPSFLYYTHRLHHHRKHYATSGDGEYLPLGAEPPWHIALYLGQSFVLPVLAVVRFLVISPLSWISPTVRGWTQRYASAMVIDPTFVRPTPGPKELKWWRVQEAACFLFLSAAVVGFLTGLTPWKVLGQAYLLAVCILTLNAVRTLAAHRYRHQGAEVTFLDQLVDSINHPNRPWLGELWAPVGLRFHALHHLFPSLPYHNLAEAHRRLMAHLPSDSPYRLTNSPSLFASLADLWRSSWSSLAAQKKPQAAPVE